MTNDEFVAKYSGAPMSIEDIALAAEEECEEDLCTLASELMDALVVFRARLADYDFEQG